MATPARAPLMLAVQGWRRGRARGTCPGSRWEPGGRDGHTGPCSRSRPAGLFLTQPVQLVHVVVSGERNLGNVVIWRRTCPLRGNGTVLGESQGTGTGQAGTGTAAGRLRGYSLGRWPARGAMQDGCRRCLVLGTGCWAGTAPPGCMKAPTFISHIYFPHLFPKDCVRGGRGRDSGMGVQRAMLRRSVKAYPQAGAQHRGPLRPHPLAAPYCGHRLTRA